MSDYDDYLNPPSDEGLDPDYAAATQATRVPSQHAAMPTSATVTGNAQVSTLRPGLEGLRLGEFDTRQMCFMRPLTRLAWAYLATMAEGRTMDALGILSVYRAMYNSQREAIAPGFAPEMRAALPARLDETAWTDPMRISIALVLGSLTGSTAARREQLARIPASAGAIGAWFTAIRSLFDEAALRTYLEVPRLAGEELAPSVLRAVQADVADCLNPPATGGGGWVIGPTTGLSPCPPGSVRVGGRCVSTKTTPGGGGGGGGGGGSGGGPSQNPPSQQGGSGLLIGVLLLLAAGTYWVYRKDSKARLGGEDEE